nr:somatostatin receptor type 5 [Anolis sagrei ordinatus]
MKSMDPLYFPSISPNGANISFGANATANTTLPGFPSSDIRSIFIPIIYLLVCAIGLSGNALVIYVVVRYTTMKTVTNIYILNLAIADVLFMLGLPFLATQNAISYWPFGTSMCRLVTAFDGINQFTSIFCLTVMSLDRYLAVVHPLKSTVWRRPKVAKLISLAVWTFSFLVVLPMIIFADVQETLHTCNMSWPDPVEIWSAVFIIYTSVLGFFGPLLVICLCYLLIVIKVKSSGIRVGSTRRRRTERKVTRMVVIIVVVFIFCWLPFYVLNIVNLIFILPEEPVLVGVFSFVVILSYANSCANPILYAFLSDNFKQSFQKVLCLHADSGLEDGDPTEQQREKSSRLQEAMLLQRSVESNGHMQTSKV